MTGGDGGPQVRVIRADADLDWQEIPGPPGDDRPPEYEVIAFRSDDERFSVGMWQRDPETGPFEPPYHEMFLLIEGRVEITTEDGQILEAGPGDMVIAPKGARATWRGLAPVRKFWAVYKE